MDIYDDPNIPTIQEYGGYTLKEMLMDPSISPQVKQQEVERVGASAVELNYYDSIATNAELWGKFYQTEDSPKKKQQFVDNNTTVNKQELSSVTKDVTAVLPAFSYELESIGLDKMDAANLLVQTAVHESGGLKYKEQLGGGPAKSYFQVEPKTVKSIIKNSSSILGPKFEQATGVSKKDLEKHSTKDIEELLLTNQRFAAAMALATYYTQIKSKGGV